MIKISTTEFHLQMNIKRISYKFQIAKLRNRIVTNGMEKPKHGEKRHQIEREWACSLNLI